MRKALIVAWHVAGVCLTYYLCFWVRFDGSVPPEFMAVYWTTLPVLVIISVLSFLTFHQYGGLWSYFTIDDLAKLGAALTMAMGLFAVTLFAMRGWSFSQFPRSALALEYLMQGVWVGGGRLAVRYIREYRDQRRLPARTSEDRILIVGSLFNADLLLRGTRGASIGRFVGLVNDEESGREKLFRGVRLFEARLEKTGSLVRDLEATSVLILPPFNRPQVINAIVSSCSEARVPVKFRTIPSLADLACGDLIASSIRKVDIEDLLPRPTVLNDRAEVQRFLQGRKVMVTGAGGSIGSELCRQIARYEPDVLVLFESSEFALYTVEQNLRRRFPNLRTVPFAGDVRHPEEVRAAIRGVDGIDIVYHAAAYKHVPLMEANVAACFRTNVLGTARMARVAVEEGVGRVVVISSDKAVRPSSVMGATKRIAERVVGEMPAGETTFVAVRFGNVLESSGSVIPLFKRLIAEGKPVPVTSPEVRRFFMTIQEAVDLVLQAGVAGRSGDVMVLEMGEPVRIVDLARRLIELSGLVPDKDIPIEFVGLRPGEKEFEEVMTADENVQPTTYERISVLRRNGGSVSEPSPASTTELARIQRLVEANDETALRRLAAEYVPENELGGRAGGQGRVLRLHQQVA